MNNTDCITLDDDRIFRKSRVESNYYENCKKIIIDVDIKNIFL